MADIVVTGDQLIFNGKSYRCTVGKGGFSSDKKEGDGATPIGVFPLRECWYRIDRLPAPRTELPSRAIQKTDGWCDDPKHPDYNRHVILPSNESGNVCFAKETGKIFDTSYSFEHLWREDHAYDLIVPIGYNDEPVVKGKGSAIFIHLNHDDSRPTAGCVALQIADLIAMLASWTAQTHIRITGP